MNQFKKDLHGELEGMSLSEEKKQFIAMKAKAKNNRQQGRSHWQYRLILTVFTMLSLGFGYILWQQKESVDRLQGAAPTEPEPTMSWSMLNHDFWKIILLISFFVMLRMVIKKRLQKKGKGLPVCVECGEEWTFREATKQSWKSSEVTCPYCTQKQYRTKKSALKGNLLNIPIFSMMFALQFFVFDSFLLGLVVYLACAIYFLFSLYPYFMELQKTDPSNEFLGDEK